MSNNELKIQQIKNINPDVPNKITNYQTSNKSDRNINTQFDQKKFNIQFEENYLQINKETTQTNSNDMNHYDEISDKLLPHQKPVQDIIINIREMFYRSLELLIDKQNPIPYILSTPDRQFSFAILLIVIGALLLLFSNLMISSEEKK
jgi:hypothetical protein